MYCLLAKIWLQLKRRTNYIYTMKDVYLIEHSRAAIMQQGLCAYVSRWIVVAKDKSVSPTSRLALLHPTPHKFSIIPDNLEQQEQK